MTVDLHLVLQIANGLLALLAAGYAAMARSLLTAVKLEMQTLRTEIAQNAAAAAEKRAQEADELRKWINGSFMRADVVDAKIDALTRHMGHSSHRT